MLTVEELEESIFKLEKFKFIVGEYATYNEYYKLSLSQEKLHLKIGVQVSSAGIKPQAEFYKNRILIGAGEKFYVYDLDGNLIKDYLAYPVFYEFIICEDHVLVINELSVFLLNASFDKLWEKTFNEIIDFLEVKELKITLRDYNGTLIHFDFLTGQEMN